jgi:hypothetical protein
MLPEKNRWREATILLATTALFYVKDLFSFLAAGKFAGRDLASNYAFTWLMQQNLLHGEIFRWTNKWLLGFPSFEMYPPFFFVFTSGLNLLTGDLLGLESWFKATVFLSLFLVPLLTYFLAAQVFDRDEAFFAGFYTLLFLFVYKPVSQVYLVLSTGLVAQGFSFLLVLASAGLMLKDERKYKIISGALLGLSALSHPFVASIGFILSGSLFLLSRDFENLIPAALGGIIVLPWLLMALQHLQYMDTYTFSAANTGTFLYLLLPLIVAGGYRGARRRALLLTFSGLLAVSIFEFPIITQELRFYTYALGIGSILAGMGAYRILEHLDQEFEIDRKLIILALLLPVLGLALQAHVPQTWELQSDTSPLINELENREKGRVLVETSNSSIYDSFALQAEIPMETRHWAVNDVHLDSSPSANYILKLESWISENAVTNPICRTCNTSASPQLIDQRLDDLGIRYIVVRTDYSRELLGRTITSQGRYGDYWLFENTEGHKLREELEEKPVTLVGSYRKWRKVNDLLFTSNSSAEITWQPKNTGNTKGPVVDMKELSPREVVEEIRQLDRQNLKGTTVIKTKFSHFTGNSTSRGTFNTQFTGRVSKIDKRIR